MKTKQPPKKEGEERHEPGKPTRGAPPEADPESVRIARQQGTSQRGFTEDEGASPKPDDSTTGTPRPDR